MMFPVTVKVGQAPHPVETTHYIQFIDLYAGPTFLSRITLTPTLPKPKATFFLVLDEPVNLRAVSFCNQHGFWESEHLAMV
jgi:superoxide reductase